MVNNTQRRFTSRSNRPKKPNRTNKILNALIGLVVVMIVITAGVIFLGNNDAEKADGKNDTEETKSSSDETETTDESVASEEETEVGSEEIISDEESTEETEEETTTEDPTPEDPTTGGTVTSTPSNDPLISEKIVNTAWKPVGTTQTGEHTSVYSEGHVDWDEKIKAIIYTTGLSTDNMIVWRIANGGSPQKSIGVVSSKNKEEKYRVSLQWVEGEGWKPEKMETLKTLNGAY
ncbi:YrrS family protein [Paenisporosarcina antarctica]|uniref:DUF1510 family protein n=1 Tax=Paenisporosarcina antarctica TaxID=417367 RepID=A0A4P6ZX53_9BACL|nr:YrrS family protein [Paenisporosarcina antarctica]QBP40834.1 DUF1510 family protein [Paenisporosarcina antarctica]